MLMGPDFVVFQVLYVHDPNALKRYVLDFHLSELFCKFLSTRSRVASTPPPFKLATRDDVRIERHCFRDAHLA